MPSEKAFGMRLAPEERRQIERLARARGTSMKEAVLDAVRHRLGELAEPEEGFVPSGRLRAARHLIGSFEGPEDLSSNPNHLADYGS